MYTNADCTLYLHSKEGRTEKYTRLPIERVFWDEVEQSTVLRAGQKNTTSVLIVIPAESLNNPLNITANKDLVIKGIVMDEIDCSTPEILSKSLAALKQAHNYVTVTGMDGKLYGNESMQHYELSCR